MKVLYASSIEKVETRSDGTLKITSGTSREMSAAEMTALFSFKGKECWTLHSFKDDLADADVPDDKPDTLTGGKTPSQRLRATLFVLWTQRGKQGDFESYYRSHMERIIDQIKDKLE